MNRKVLLWSITVALGGFLFGFDTAVISGAEKSIQELWRLDVFEHGLTVSIALIGTVCGSLLGGFPTERFGRKKTLYMIAFLYLISALGCAFTNNWFFFLFARWLGGVGVGASSVTAPLYISEISPTKSRGRLVGLFQFNIVLGILIAYLSNYLFINLGDNAWRWMLGVQALPSMAFLLFISFIPESPRWLIQRGRIKEAEDILKVANSGEDVTSILNNFLESKNELDKVDKKHAFFSRQYFKPIMLATVFAIFNQLSGINAIIYYSPRIFEMAGLGKNVAFLSSAGIGLVNFVFTLLALRFIDHLGRRTLMLIGSAGLILVLGLVAKAFYLQEFGSMTVPIYLFIYIAFFAFSQGAVIWVFISEIFPNNVRAYGQGLGSFTHWFMAALVSFSFPYIVESIGPGNTFMFFSIMMMLQLLFVWLVMPETKGVSLEQIGDKIIMH